MHVTVLMGGDSPEREVSLRSGGAVADGLERAGWTVDRRDIPDVGAALGMDFSGTDLVFPALHGGHGEDGHLQAVLDVKGVPYALSGHRASAVAMDKSATKQVMKGAGIATPDWLLITWDAALEAPVAVQTPEPGGAVRGDLALDHVRDRALAELGFPLVVKLNGAGSSVGVEIVETPDGFADAFARVAAAALGGRAEILLERFVPGRELTAAIFLGRRLPLLEIRPRDGFYDYQNKYTSGASEYLCPAPVDSPFYENMCADALRLFDLLGCRGVARVDFRFDGARHWCLEINTIPGMTTLSLVPMAAAAVGIGFDAMVDDLCRDALLRRGLPADR